MRSVIEQEEVFVTWVTENQTKRAGKWYGKFLSKLGLLLNEFKISDGLKNNFFEYQSYKEFEAVYLDLTAEEEKDIKRILNGDRVQYLPAFLKIQSKWDIEYRNYAYDKGLIKRKTGFQSVVSLGTVLRTYLRFLYYDENKDLIYPKKISK